MQINHLLFNRHTIEHHVALGSVYNVRYTSNNVLNCTYQYKLSADIPFGVSISSSSTFNVGA